MKTDQIPVWVFFEIPENGIELSKKIAGEYPADSRESNYWLRVGKFLSRVKSQTADQLNTRDFDWMLKIRVLFEKDETVLHVRSQMRI